MSQTQAAVKIIFEDPHLIVLDKPAGLLSQGEHRGDPNLVDWLRNYLGRNYVGLIHRLDRNTSGIMIVAKRSKSAQRLSEALRRGEINRTYLGWVEGKLEAPVHWRHFLWKDSEKNQVHVVREDREGAKKATLTANPKERALFHSRPITLLEFILETGRSHQIRAQSAHEGFPILGDKKYGRASDFPRTALHSYRIVFPHPMTHEKMEFNAPPPDDMKLEEKNFSKKTNF